MLTIEIPINFLKNLKRYRKKDFQENLTDNVVYEKIIKTLIYDKLITEDQKIEWKQIQNKFQGVLIKEFNKVVYFAQMLEFSGKTRSRNTYLSQNFNPIFKYAKERGYYLSISINPFDLLKNSFPITIPTIQKDLKTFVTLGVKLNHSINYKNTVFNNLEEYIIERNKLKERNKGNNSTYIKIFYDEKKICVYGRLDGASGVDTINACRIISKLADSENFHLEFYQLLTKFERLKDSLEIIRELGFLIIDSEQKEIALQDDFQQGNYKDDYDQLLKRNQGLFIKNIIQKYIDVKDFNLHRCFCCNYIIESNFIAAHIYRYSDILKDFFNFSKLTISQAVHLMVSGENGFFFCPNHDKEYEKGMIIFDFEKKEFVPNKNLLSHDEFQQVQKNVYNQDFKEVFYSEEFYLNIKQHLKRVGI